MGEFGMPITHIIHNSNHIRFMRKAIINHPEDIIDHPGLIKFPKKFRDLEAGIHRVVFEKYPTKVFYFNMYCNCGPNELVIIDNINYAHFVTGVGTYPILLYEETTADDCYIMDNTLNDYLNLLMVDGETSITYSNEDKGIDLNNPCSLAAVDSLTVETSNGNDSKNDKQIFNLRHELRSLPDGRKDLFVLDAENERAYILYKVGHTAITGMEEITKVDSFSNDLYSVYFIKNDNVIKTDNPESLICTHFKSIQYDKFRRLEFNQNSICISYDEWRGRGFYIKISNEIAPTLDSFIQFVNGNLFMTNKLEVMFPLVKSCQTNVLLDEYHVRTFFDKTKLKLQGSKDLPTYFFKTTFK
jgi:hypothetical protein